MKIKFDAEDAIRHIAKKEGVSVEEIRSQMSQAMLTGLNSEDPDVQARWKQIPCKGEVPTPEELITYIATHINAEISPLD